jgi:hypothetical protein
MKEIVTSKGVLKYRLPNIAEAHKFISFFYKVNESNEVFFIKGSVIGGMGSLINYQDLGYSSYDEVLNDRENMTVAISQIGQEIFDDMLDFLTKKN